MASNTPNINLYKKDPVADATDTFNIKTMMNDNWDKIDTEIKTIKDNAATHSAEKATLELLGHVKPDGTSITIDENGVISANKLITNLYNSGVEAVPWVVGYSIGTGSQSKQSDHLYLYSAGVATEPKNSDRYYVTDVLIDLTNINTLYIEAETTQSSSDNNTSFYLGVSSVKLDNSIAAGYLLVNQSSARQVFSLDVKALTGQYYVKIRCFAYDVPRTSELKVYKVWGER